MKRISVIALAAAALVGCTNSGGSDGNQTGSNDNGECNAGSDGTTQCGAGLLTCNAGQYCALNAECTAGCTSNNNCSAGEECVRAPGAAVGACAACAMDSGPDSGACEDAVDRAFDCGLIDNTQLAAGKAACRNTLTETQRTALVDCVDAAATCADVVPCLGDGGSGGGGGGGSNGMCEADYQCVMTLGLLHEICSGGLCVLGCREDFDCGADYKCNETRACEPVF